MQHFSAYFVFKEKTAGLLLLFSLLLLILLLPTDVLAGQMGGDKSMPYVGFLEKVVNSMTGPVAGFISLAAIVASGAMLIFSQDLSGFFRTMVYLALVIGIIVGATSIMKNVFTGQGAQITIEINQTNELRLSE